VERGRDDGNRTVLAVFAAVGLALVGLGGLVGWGEEGSGAGGGERSASARAAALPDLRRIARRVEAIRDLRFRRLPAARLVTPAQVRRESLLQLDRGYTPARMRADEELLELLGLLPSRASLRRVAGEIFGEQVAGFYDVRRKRLSLVEGAGGSGALQEITLAHELTHALEDQRFRLLDIESLGVEDRDAAYNALIEGTATAVMNEYARRNLASGGDLGALLEGLASGGGGGDLPPYVQASLLFPYLRGSQFVASLYGTGGWRLVNSAFSRPPASTEQILHPDRYLRVEQPDRLILRTGSLLGPGWRRLSAGRVGEFDTAQVLGSGPRAAQAAAGWGGGAFELYRSGPLPDPGCAAPCRRRDALVVAWTWDAPRDARQFAAVLPGALTRRLRARRAGPGRFTIPQGALALRETRAATTLAMAPSRPLAALLASRALARTSRPGR
jgi:hypothetical protein